MAADQGNSQRVDDLIEGALGAQGGQLFADALAAQALADAKADGIVAQASGVGGASSGPGTRSPPAQISATSSSTTTAEATPPPKPIASRAWVELGDGGDVGGSGDFDGALVVAMFKKRLGAIRECYAHVLTDAPAAEGKITVEFTIETDGGVSSVRTVRDEVDAAVGECAAAAVRSFRFAPGPEGGAVTFAYAVLFRRQS